MRLWSLWLPGLTPVFPGDGLGALLLLRLFVAEGLAPSTAEPLLLPLKLCPRKEASRAGMWSDGMATKVLKEARATW